MAAAKNPSRGEEHYNHKLTAEDVALIRALVDERNRLLSEANKLTDAKIAEKFEIHKNTVWKITRFETWINVSGGASPES